MNRAQWIRALAWTVAAAVAFTLVVLALAYALPPVEHPAPLESEVVR